MLRVENLSKMHVLHYLRAVATCVQHLPINLAGNGEVITITP